VSLARRGFAVAATDAVPSGLAACAAWLAREELSATLARHDMETLPFPNGAFDGLVSYNVIYHATVAGMQRTLVDFVLDDLHLSRKEYADEDGIIRTGVHYHVQARRNASPDAQIFYKE
jgi:hypothetical protein